MQNKLLIKKILYFISDNPINKILLNYDLEKRSKLELVQINELSQKINIFSPFTKEIHKPNDWYGHANNLKIFLGLPKNYQFKFVMEHGLYLNDQVDQIDRETNLPTFITYSKYREKILKEYRKNVFSIGPFIHYARTLLSNEKIKSEKNRLGKSVLFFPAHSTSTVNLDYDIENLCKALKKISKNYRSIRVCLYWKDILNGSDNIYRNHGFECVTAGHMLDPLFLPRLRSLIEISDLTSSNIISSQAGFSIHLGKPHIIINQKIKVKTDRYWQKRINDVFESDGYIEVLEEFAKINYKITPKQKSLVNIFWGSNQVKSKLELRRIIDSTEKIFNNEK